MHVLLNPQTWAIATIALFVLILGIALYRAGNIIFRWDYRASKDEIMRDVEHEIRRVLDQPKIEFLITCTIACFCVVVILLGKQMLNL